MEKIISIMSQDIPHKLAEDCFQALLDYVERLARAKNAQSVPGCLPSGPSLGSLL